MDFFIGNVDDFRAAVQHGRSFATEVARDGLILYGTVGGGMNKDERTPMEFRLANVTAITDEDIERECAEYESGSWAGTLTSLPIGRPRLSDGKDDANLSFKCPKTMPPSSRGRPQRAGCRSLSSCARPQSRRPRKSSGRHRTHQNDKGGGENLRPLYLLPPDAHQAAASENAV